MVRKAEKRKEIIWGKKESECISVYVLKKIRERISCYSKSGAWIDGPINRIWGDLHRFVKTIGVYVAI